MLQPEELKNPEFRSLASRVCDVAVMATCYWEVVEPTRDVYDFRRSQQVLDFALNAAQAVRGHTLVWHKVIPRWVHETVGTSSDRDLLVNHVHTVVSHFSGRVKYWDVLNEVVYPADGRSDGLRQTIWLQRYGPSYIASALETARRADPHAALGCNEAGIEADSPAAASKRAGLLRLLADLRRRNVPLDYVGVEAHLYPGQTYSARGLGRFLREVADIGYAIQITELDVNDRPLPRDQVRRDAAVAEQYNRFLDVVMENASPEVVTTWGLVDSGSWQQQEQPRDDGVPQRPLPFDAALQPKAAWSVLVAHAIGGARKR